MLLLDTSAVIGWLERTGSSVPDLLRGADDVGIHPVTLGELAAGVRRAKSPPLQAARAATLDFATRRLRLLPSEQWLPADAFAIVQVVATRRLSHNDMWIVAAASRAPATTLVTEDRRLSVVAGMPELHDAFIAAGLHPPSCELTASRSTSDPS